jgi:hypothetical protein
MAATHDQGADWRPSACACHLAFFGRHLALCHRNRAIVSPQADQRAGRLSLVASATDFYRAESRAYVPGKVNIAQPKRPVRPEIGDKCPTSGLICRCLPGETLASPHQLPDLAVGACICSRPMQAAAGAKQQRKRRSAPAGRRLQGVGTLGACVPKTSGRTQARSRPQGWETPGHPGWTRPARTLRAPAVGRFPTSSKNGGPRPIAIITTSSPSLSEGKAGSGRLKHRSAAKPLSGK